MFTLFVSLFNFVLVSCFTSHVCACITSVCLSLLCFLLRCAVRLLTLEFLLMCFSVSVQHPLASHSHFKVFSLLMDMPCFTRLSSTSAKQFTDDYMCSDVFHKRSVCVHAMLKIFVCYQKQPER